MSWVNYDDVLGQIQDAGLVVRELKVDTPKSERCYVEGHDREKRGWYWLHDIDLEDNGERNRYLIGAFGIFRGDDSGSQKIQLRRDGKRRTLSREQREAVNRRLKENQRRLNAQRQAQADRAARSAAYAWRKYLPSGTSEYLDKKGVEAFGLRFAPSGNGTVAVPMTDTAGRIWGLQIIRSQPKRAQLQKQYWPKGLSKQGRFHLIGGAPRGVLLIAEGYATAASVHQATGLSVAVAFDAGNLQPVAVALADQYRGLRILICADDDYKTDGNPGVSRASEAALAVGGKFLAPVFADERPTDRKGPTDFNDLHQLEGLHVVRAQIDGYLSGVGWGEAPRPIRARDPLNGGAGAPMVPRLTIDDAVARYWGTYGFGGKILFDKHDRRLVHRDDVLNLLPRHGWEQMREHPDWRVAREQEIGFDPTERDEAIRCNLYGGWPTEPKPGCCERLIELLEYICNDSSGDSDLFTWLIRWLAYPIQHPGAKMQSAVVVHGPQGTGKSMVFEAVAKIYGPYGRILGQDALEDRFNSDWAEKKLFILADEILARSDMFHVKNRLKGFITGDTIRVNPKNMAAHNERNSMNIVFVSNERLPLVLENDDRRHCVIWTPPKLDPGIYNDVAVEMDNGGIAALHQYLLDVDLDGFKPWTKPPLTQAKQDLIHLGLSSEERFCRDWENLEIEDSHGEPMPFCPCASSDLYRAYEAWCRRNGEQRPRPANHFINFVGKQPGWTAGRPHWTKERLNAEGRKQRKLIVPAAEAMARATRLAGPGSAQSRLEQAPEDKALDWLTRGYFAFQSALNIDL